MAGVGEVYTRSSVVINSCAGEKVVIRWGVGSVAEQGISLQFIDLH